MEDGNKQPHTFGSGQQRTHPRPFFYVHPPSQPYYLYQHWQLNNPYSHYGLPGDRLCREDLTTLDQGRWADGDVIPRRRQANPLQRQEMSTQRKVIYHRPRDEDNDGDEPPPSHWERGSVIRGEPRC